MAFNFKHYVNPGVYQSEVFDPRPPAGSIEEHDLFLIDTDWYSNYYLAPRSYPMPQRVDVYWKPPYEDQERHLRLENARVEFTHRQGEQPTLYICEGIFRAQVQVVRRRGGFYHDTHVYYGHVTDAVAGLTMVSVRVDVANTKQPSLKTDKGRSLEFVRR